MVNKILQALDAPLEGNIITKKLQLQLQLGLIEKPI